MGRSNSLQDLPQALPSTKEFSKLLKNRVKITKQDPFKVYTLLCKIGKGATGYVYKVQKASTNKSFALKQIEPKKSFNKEKIINEIGIMILSHHPNIIQCYEAYEHKNLSTCVKFSETHMAYISKEILQGIQWLHDKKRMHRDIKTDNILFNAHGDVKISDFGFSTQLTVENQNRISMVGTPCWMAPEIIFGDGYDTKVDIWAVGVLIYELAEGKTPAHGKNSMEILCSITNSPSPELSPIWSHGFINFTKLCLEKNPQQRASAQELLEHEFLRQASKEKFLEIVEEYIKLKN